MSQDQLTDRGIFEIQKRTFDDLVRKDMIQREVQIRRLLEQWVSELPPALAVDDSGEIIGLCDADVPLGSFPYIFRGRKE